MVLTPSNATAYSIEDRMAATIASRGQEYMVSSSVFPSGTRITKELSHEQMREAIIRTGCDAIFVISLLDVRTTETYNPGGSVAYAPYSNPYYRSFYGYYDHHYPYVYSEGYYSSSSTYFIETNFYDVDEDRLLWSIQSEAYDPSSLDSWFDTYIYQLMQELEAEGLIQKGSVPRQGIVDRDS